MNDILSFFPVIADLIRYLLCRRGIPSRLGDCGSAPAMTA